MVLLDASVYNELADFPTNSTYTSLQARPVACLYILLRPYASGNE